MNRSLRKTTIFHSNAKGVEQAFERSKTFGNFITDDFVSFQLSWTSFDKESFPKSKRGKIESRVNRLLGSFDSVNEQDAIKDHSAVTKRKANYIYYNDENTALMKNKFQLTKMTRLSMSIVEFAKVTITNASSISFSSTFSAGKKIYNSAAVSGSIFSEKRRR